MGFHFRLGNRFQLLVRSYLVPELDHHAKALTMNVRGLQDAGRSKLRYLMDATREILDCATPEKPDENLAVTIAWMHELCGLLKQEEKVGAIIDKFDATQYGSIVARRSGFL